MTRLCSFPTRYYFVFGALILSFSHYLAAVYLPVTDTEETYRFLEPIHYLLYGTGKQTWENCSYFGLCGYLFSLIYAIPVLLRYRVLPLVLTRLFSVFGGIFGIPFASYVIRWIGQPPRSVDVYFFQRVAYGQVACLAELFFLSSIHSAYTVAVPGHGIHTSLIALGILVTSSSIPHAAVSALPTSFSMICYFLVVGCWLRSGLISERRKDNKKKMRAEDTSVNSSEVPSSSEESLDSWEDIKTSSETQAFFTVLCVGLIAVIGFVGWPCETLMSLPIWIDLLCKSTSVTFWSSLSLCFFIAACVVSADTFFFCTPTFSTWNILRYRVLGKRDAIRFDVQSFRDALETLLINFNVVFLMALLSPIVVLCGKRSRPIGIRRSLFSLCTLSTSSSRRSQKTTTDESKYSALQNFFDSYPPLLKPYHCWQSEGCYLLPFFLYFFSGLLIPHGKEVVMAPSYPFLVLSATLSLSRLFIHSASEDAYVSEISQLWCHMINHQKKSLNSGKTINQTGEKNSIPPCVPFSTMLKKNLLDKNPKDTFSSMDSLKASDSSVFTSSIATLQKSLCEVTLHSGLRRRWLLLLFFLLTSGMVSFSRGLALYHFYSGPQRMFYDAYPFLSSRTEEKWNTFKASSSSNGTDSESHTKRVEFPSNHTLMSREESPSAKAQFRLCLGREWYRFPSSFFLDFNVPLPFPTQRTPSVGKAPFRFPSLYDFYSLEAPSTPVSTYGFLKTKDAGALPLDFFPSNPESIGLLNISVAVNDFSSSLWEKLWPKTATIPRACHCASQLVNEQNIPLPVQHVENPSMSCDAVFDSIELPPPSTSKMFPLYIQEKDQWEAMLLEKVKESHLEDFSQPIGVSSSAKWFAPQNSSNYRILDVHRTPVWCRALYFPFGISESCAVWKKLALQEKPKLNNFG